MLATCATTFLPSGFDDINEDAAAPQNLPLNIDCAIPVTSPLSLFWFANNEYEKGALKTIGNLAAVYIGGMIGYSLALVYRVAALAYRVAKLVFTVVGFLFCCKTSEELKYTAWKTIRRFLEVISASFGIVCPPVGYLLDRKIDCLADRQEKKFYLIQITNPVMTSMQALEVLGFSRDARPTEREITTAYRAQVRDHHPDRSNGEEREEIRNLNNARGVLQENPTGYLTHLRFIPLKFVEQSEDFSEEPEDSDGVDFEYI